MKRLFLRWITPLCIGIAIPAPICSGQGRVTVSSASGRLAGTWRLVSLQEPGHAGRIHNIDCTGMLIATPDGHFSVQVMDRSPQPEAVPGPERYSQGGYEASFGTYVADESAHTFTFHVEGALVRSLIGKDLPRVYELSGGRLIVKSAHMEEHWRATWERYP